MFEYFAHGGERPDFPAGVLVQAGEALPPVGSTEREQVIAARKGQGIYRERLLAKWNGACAVTGLAEPALHDSTVRHSRGYAILQRGSTTG